MTDISTHYLTQRQTGMDQEQQQDMLFQLTTSRRGRPGQRKRSHAARHFNSLPHAEVDGRVWKSSGTTCISTHYLTQRQTTSGTRLLSDLLHFNSLPHAEVDNHLTIQSSSSSVFQLTTSRRGRHYRRRAKVARIEYFNSLPHAEVDSIYHKCCLFS